MTLKYLLKVQKSRGLNRLLHFLLLALIVMFSESYSRTYRGQNFYFQKGSLSNISTRDVFIP